MLSKIILMPYQSIKKIIWANPENELALFQQGVCFYKLNYSSEAQQNFKKLLENNPDHYNSKYYLALINYENEKFSESIPIFRFASVRF